MLLSCKKKMLSGNLVQSVSHMYMHISLKVKQGFREEGDLIVLYVSKKNIEGQNITDRSTGIMAQGYHFPHFLTRGQGRKEQKGYF